MGHTIKHKRKTNSKQEHSKKNTHSYVLIIDIGTFCDYRMMDTAITELRKTHKIVYITNKEHTLFDTDIRIEYTLPSVILDHPGEIATNLTGSIDERVLYSISHPYTIVASITSLVHITTLLKQTICDYNPVRILAHCGNVQHIVASDCYKSIPTSILYFAPGFLPNTDVPFVFHNELKNNPSFDIFNPIFANFNQQTGEAYHTQMEKTISVKQYLNALFFHSDYSHLKQMRHIMCFSQPLVPKIHYTLPDVSIHNVGILPARLSTNPLEHSLQKWVNTHNGKVIFVSFGSYLPHLLKKIPLFLNILEHACIENDLYAIFHDESKQTAGLTSRRVRIHTTFVPYPSIVKHCLLVCFTGSACLQNVCWIHKCRMLFVPYLPEQYFWAKLYRRHTHVDYIDYQNQSESVLFAHKLFQAIHIKKNFLIKVSQSISPNISKRIATEILR